VAVVDARGRVHGVDAGGRGRAAVGRLGPVSWVVCLGRDAGGILNGIGPSSVLHV
jgi:hypothetical protein